MPNQIKTETELKTKTAEKTEKKATYFEAVGRRKDAQARVRLYVVAGEKSIMVGGKELKAGDVIINGRPSEKYFSGKVFEKLYLEPFRTTNTLGRFAVSVTVEGGGTAGQVGAFVHAVSRALLKVDLEKFRPILKKKGYLTRDSRMKERRKAGNAQKARAKKQSPKR